MSTNIKLNWLRNTIGCAILALACQFGCVHENPNPFDSGDSVEAQFVSPNQSRCAYLIYGGGGPEGGAYSVVVLATSSQLDVDEQRHVRQADVWRDGYADMVSDQ
jgi:hypothetical protein